MNKNHFPTGWDEARVRRVLDHYENISDEEMIAEDEAARESGKNHLPVSTELPKINGKVFVKGAGRKKKTKQPKVLPHSKQKKGK